MSLFWIPLYNSFCRLLTIWFEYGNNPEIYEALVEGIKTIQIDNWLQVLQLWLPFLYLPIPQWNKYFSSYDLMQSVLCFKILHFCYEVKCVSYLRSYSSLAQPFDGFFFERRTTAFFSFNCIILGRLFWNHLTTYVTRLTITISEDNCNSGSVFSF